MELTDPGETILRFNWDPLALIEIWDEDGGTPLQSPIPFKRERRQPPD